MGPARRVLRRRGLGYLPDVITTAKGITSAYAPMGAVIASDRVAEPFLEAPTRSPTGSRSAGTPWPPPSPSPTSTCSRTRASSSTCAPTRASSGDARFAARHPDRRRRARHGLLQAIELVKDRETKETFAARGGLAAARLPVGRPVPARADLPRRRPRRPGDPALAAAHRGARALRGDGGRLRPALEEASRGGSALSGDAHLRDLIGDLDLAVAGERGVDHPVRWVHISELWTRRHGCRAASSCSPRASARGPRAAARLVTRLAGHGLAGLGLGIGLHDTVPAAMIETAEELGLPAVRGPLRVPFIALTEKAFSRLVNEHYALLQRAIAAHERLERIMLSERGLDGVVGRHSGADPRPGRRVRRARRRCSSAARTVDARRGVASRELGDELRRRTADGVRRGFAPGGEPAGGALALPVSARLGLPRGGGLYAARLADRRRGARRPERARPARPSIRR